jgi:NitT/TauT family transport system ATP-binding protein
MIRFKNVIKSFYGRMVLNEISFTIEKNEIVGLVGRSGAGKSTILRMISGLTQPDSGNVNVESKKIGYIFQEPNLIPWRTALGNLYFTLRAMGLDKRTYRDIAMSWLDKMELRGFEQYYPCQLSGGMRQRVAIARAFSIDPDILLMDEPFSALDPGLKGVMHSLMKEVLSERPTTVLYVSHNPNEVARIANRICTITQDGRLKERRTVVVPRK